MDEFKLRFPGSDVADLPLGMGVHGIGPGSAGAFGRVADQDAARVQFSVDRRGVWLSVGEDTRGVHVNGRPIQRVAMLRIGDSVYVDGVEIMLVANEPVSGLPPGVADAPAVSGDDPRIVLRGVGGRYHGRSFTLEQPRLIGRSPDADVRIDDSGFAERHARIDLRGDTIVLRDLGSTDGSVVNGVIVRDALLKPGDQVMFDAHHRFVVEAPGRALGGDAGPGDVPEETAHPQLRPAPSMSARRLPWLLLAALLIAAALSALLLFGVSS